MKEQNQNSVNLEIPGRWRRFFAYLLDFIINITVIGFIINIIIILSKRATAGNLLLGIRTINNDNNKISLGKAFLRYFIFYVTLLILGYFIWYSISLLFQSVPALCQSSSDSDFCRTKHIIGVISEFICIIFSIPLIINLIEIFFKCPTFIDKRLGIKRIKRTLQKN